VVYNNRFGSTRGTIDFSAAYADKGAGHLRQQRLSEGLGLSSDGDAILAFRDSLTGLEYLRRLGQLSSQGLTLDLHAYQCHVFLDWRELRATADQPWDRLCDQLNGAGVPSLDDALVSLELRPVHDALRMQLDSGVVRLLADLAEHPRSIADGKDKKAAEEHAQERKEFFDLAWRRCESFLREAQTVYVSRVARDGGKVAQATAPSLLGPVFRERLLAAMRIPVIEAAFPRPWTAAARRVLPSPSPQFTATAMWGPLLGWCALELLAESIDADAPEKMALDLFDRLRLREPFGQAFGALGFEGEEGWRVAARIKVVLLSEAGIGKPAIGEPGDSAPEAEAVDENEASTAAKAVFGKPAKLFVKRPAAVTPVLEQDKLPACLESVALAPSLWLDPDVRWLTGVHESEGHAYLVRERYEELLWWLLMPSLLCLASETKLDRKAIGQIGKLVDDALESAEAAGYRIDRLLGMTAEADVDDEAERKETAESNRADLPEKGEPASRIERAGPIEAAPSKTFRKKEQS
jgi:hypothetical protein